MGNSVLFANGCSMTYGSGLYENTESKVCFDHDMRMKCAWPGLLGKKLGVSSIINLGYPSSSNDRIIRTTISWIVENWLTTARPVDSLFVVIGWSHPMRREFFINDEWRQLIPYHDYVDPPASLLNRIYREVAWSEYESAIRFINQVILLQQFLHSHNISYLFFDAIVSIAQTSIDAKNALDPFLKTINAQQYFNIGDVNGDMARQLGIDQEGATRTHPNEQGHARWSELLANYIEQENLFTQRLQEPVQEPSFEGNLDAVIRDKKIGLSRVPQGAQPLTSDYESLLANQKNQNLLQRLRNAFKKDPFIYD